MRIMKIAFVVAVLFPIPSVMSASKARHVVVFPKGLQGTWDLGPQVCKLPVNPDSDSPIRIESGRVFGYEHVETPLRISAASARPSAWTVTAISGAAPGVKTDDLYILKGDYLTISDGATTRQYRRCK